MSPDVKLLIGLGMHRSGTSLIARILGLLGYKFGDNLLPPQPDNPEGFWEDADIVSFNKRLLIKYYSTWDRPVLYFGECFEWQEEDISQGANLLKNKLAGQKKLVLKDPRFCLLLPFWESVFVRVGLSPKFIFVYRNPLDVAASLSSRNHFDHDKSIKLWLIYNSLCLRGLKEKTFMVINYAEMVIDKYFSKRAVLDMIEKDFLLNKGVERSGSCV